MCTARFCPSMADGSHDRSAAFRLGSFLPTDLTDAGHGRSSGRVVALGEAMLRLATQPGDRLRNARFVECGVAGAEFNVVMGLGHLGVLATWISAVPDTPLGWRVADELATAGVSLEGLAFVPDGRLGLFFVEMGDNPRPTHVLYDRKDSAFSRLKSFSRDLLKGAAFAVVSGITPGLGAVSRSLAREFIAEAIACGAALCVDVNYRSLLWSPDAARNAIAELIAPARIVICREHDARLVFGCHGSVEAVLHEFVETWTPAALLTILTLGSDGSLLFDARKHTVHAEPAIPARVMDRFGVGDAFTAGLLWGLLRGWEPEKAHRAATALAALKCSIKGDIARFKPDEVELMLGTSPGDHEVIR
jgi:2-dehydro-3-deoxygluconokinase